MFLILVIVAIGFVWMMVKDRNQVPEDGFLPSEEELEKYGE